MEMIKLQSRLRGVVVKKCNMILDGDIMSTCREGEAGQPSQRGHASHTLNDLQDQIILRPNMGGISILVA